MAGRLVIPLAQLKQATARLAAVGAPPTPVLRSKWIDAAIGCACHFKAEHLQRTGSFKYRGATNAVGALDSATVGKGVVAHSSGNHGAAIAAAAAARGIPCTVVVPRTTPEAKVANMRRYGAQVVMCEPTQAARTAASAAEAERMGGAAFIHPYDDEMVIAGQGTIGIELLEQVPEVRQLRMERTPSESLLTVLMRAASHTPHLSPHAKLTSPRWEARTHTGDVPHLCYGSWMRWWCP